MRSDGRGDADSGGTEPELELGLRGQVAETAPGSAPAPTPAQSRSSTAFLDGLRGLAAFMVYMSHHMVWMYGTEDASNYGIAHNGIYSFSALPFVRVFFSGGAPAVSIFFVLSGYVLSRGPLGMLRGDDMNALRTRLIFSAVRRPFRLFVPVVAISFLFALSMQLPFGMEHLVGWPRPLDNLALELCNWFVEMLRVINPFVKHGISEPWFPYDPPAWTISIEFAGSILVFALTGLLTVVPTRLRAVLLAIISLALLLLYQWAMACFVAGIILAMSDVPGVADLPSFSRLRKSSRSLLYNGIFFVGWFLLSQTTAAGNVDASLETPGWYWLTRMVPGYYYENEYWRFWNDVGATMVVFATLRLRWLQRFLLLSPLRWLGKVSFSLYLTHFPLLWMVGDRIYRLFGTIPPQSEINSWFDNRLFIKDVGPHGFSSRFLVVQTFILGLNLLVAKWGTVLLDEPSIKIGRWVEMKIRGK